MQYLCIECPKEFLGDEAVSRGYEPVAGDEGGRALHGRGRLEVEHRHEREPAGKKGA